MQFRSLAFRFRWIPTLLFAVPIPLFVGLGLWQLDRADQKRDFASILAARAALPPAVIEKTLEDAGELRYRRVVASGRYVAERQFLIEGRREGSKSGFHVITPLRLSVSGALLLVNRGWVAARPGNDPILAPIPEGDVVLSGVAELPSPPVIVLHGGADAAKGWGERWPYLTVELFAATVEDPVQPFLMLLDPGAPGGFVRHWRQPSPKVWMHQGYAAQWFGFAIIALALYLRLSFERTPVSEGEI